MLFDVRLVAFDNATDGDPADALVRVFGLDHRAAQELLRRLPHVVKRGVTEEGAHKLVAALDRIGAQTEIVVSTRPAREATGARTPAQKAANPQRLGALPAPAPAATAMMDARAAREQALARAQASQVKPSTPAPQPVAARGRSAQVAYAAPIARADQISTQPDHDDDSLEADIGRPSDSPEQMLERSTLVAMPRAVPAAAYLSTKPQRPPAQRGRAPSAASAPLPAARTPAAVPAPAPVAPAVPVASAAASTSFRVTLPKVTDNLRSEPPMFGAVPTGITPSIEPANTQRASVVTGSLSRTTLSGARRPALPVLSIHGPPVEASACVMPGTKGAVAAAWAATVVLSVILTVLTFGTLTIVTLGVLCASWLGHRRTLAAIRASALPVGQSQLPEVYACVKQFALRLGLTNVPRFYIVPGEDRGLRSITDGSELLLYIDETSFLRFMDAPRPQALSCLVAHELARHALGHTSWKRRMLSRVSPQLRYLDLVSADSTATALVSDPAIVKLALLTLLGAGRLHTYLDHDELDRVATSSTRQPTFWSTRVGADDGFVLARLYHLQRGYA